MSVILTPDLFNSPVPVGFSTVVSTLNTTCRVQVTEDSVLCVGKPRIEDDLKGPFKRKNFKP